MVSAILNLSLVISVSAKYNCHIAFVSDGINTSLKDIYVVMIKKLAKKYLFIFLGSLSLILGVIGILLPVLPTTPFILLSAFCYLRGSKRLYEFVIYHKLFGKYIYNYITYRAVPKAAKICSLILLWLSLSVSIFLVPIMYIRIILAIVGISVSIHLIMMKTLTEEQMMATDSTANTCPEQNGVHENTE